jgi:hypothetical protein
MPGGILHSVTRGLTVTGETIQSYGCEFTAFLLKLKVETGTKVFKLGTVFSTVFFLMRRRSLVNKFTTTTTVNREQQD